MSLPAAEQSGTENGPSFLEFEGNSEIHSYEPHHYGWDSTANIDLFSYGVQDDDYLQLDMEDPLFLPEPDQDMWFLGEGMGISFDFPE